jgi:HlyD family secretion protein
MKQTIIKPVLIIILFTLFSCKEKKKLDSMQGKVKYETIGIAPKIPGRIIKINVAEGQLVHKGDTLAILDAPEIKAKIEQSAGAVESANAQYEMAKNGATKEQVMQIESQMDAAKDQLAFAEKTYQRMKNMFADSLVSAQQFDEVKMKYESAGSQLKALDAKRLEIVKGTRPESVLMTKGQVVRAKGAEDEAIIASNERFIIAPDDMLVETVSLTTGELALPGYTLINGYRVNSLYFRFTVAESKVNLFKVGMAVVVEVPYISKTITAKIVSVKQLARYADNTSTAPNYQLGEALYELKILPDQQVAEGLFQNSTVLLK